MRRFATMIVLSTLIATAAFAAEGGSGKIRPGSAVKVGTTELPGGGYKVTWTGSGSSTEVTLTQGKAKVTLPAPVVQTRRASDAVSARRRPWCWRVHRACSGPVSL
jgi:hypothetical protein